MPAWVAAPAPVFRLAILGQLRDDGDQLSDADQGIGGSWPIRERAGLAPREIVPRMGAGTETRWPRGDTGGGRGERRWGPGLVSPGPTDTSPATRPSGRSGGFAATEVPGLSSSRGCGGLL